MKTNLWIPTATILFLIVACERKSGRKYTADELRKDVNAAKADLSTPVDESVNNRPMTEAQIERFREMQREAQQRLDKLPPERRAALEEAAKKAQAMTPEERRRVIEEARKQLTPEQQKMIEDYQKKMAEQLSK